MLILILKTLAYTLALVAAGFLLFRGSLSKAGQSELGLRMLIVYLTLNIACFLSPSIWVLYLTGIVLIPVATRERREIAPLFLVSILATPPLDSILSIGGLTLIRWTVQHSLAVGALLAFAIGRGTVVKRRFSADIPFLIILALQIIAYSRETSFTNFLREGCSAAFSLAVPYWVITRGINPVTDTRKMFAFIGAASAMISAIAVYEAVTGWPLYRVAGFLIDRKGSGLYSLRLGLMRSSASLSNATVLGFVLVIGLIAVLLLRRSFRSPLHHAGMIALISAGIFASQSRGAMMGAAVAVVTIALYNPNVRKSIAPFLAVLVAASSFFVIIGLTRYEDAASGTVNYRTQLMTRGMEEFWKSPLYGDTVAHVKDRMPDLITGEQIVDFVNTYLYFALILGFAGALLFILSLIIPLVRLWRLRARLPADHQYTAMARLCFAFIVSAALMLIFTSVADRTLICLTVMAGIAGTIAAPRRLPDLSGSAIAKGTRDVARTEAPGEVRLPNLPGAAGDLMAGKDIGLPQLRGPDGPRLL